MIAVYSLEKVHHHQTQHARLDGYTSVGVLQVTCRIMNDLCRDVMHQWSQNTRMYGRKDNHTLYCVPEY